ncbi:MAG: DUF4097 family beta strand repeat protein [Sedimentisphaerales bacterium]|nr:DUF4097 family beta strand repeat protein [Sedimentisphaerales bacterium]
MKKIYYTVLFPGLCLLLVVSGCDFQMSDWFRAKCERTVHKQIHLDLDSNVVAKTSSGSITVTGADVGDCNVVAQVCVQAISEQQAWEIAEQVEIILEKVGNTLIIKTEQPPKKEKCSVSVSYDITVPKKTNIECASSYGPVKLSNIRGDAKAKSGSGSIFAEHIQGSANLHTSYGSVTCRNISGNNIVIQSNSGSIKAQQIKGSADLNTSYGSITCQNISGPDIKLRASSGGINLSEVSGESFDVQSSYGSIKTDNLTTKLLKLHSGSGSIDLINASADSADLFTAYGRITCRQFTTADLTAQTGSGNITIACSDSSPSEINANVVTSCGSVDFLTPPDFAGHIDMSTNYGSVNTELPITVNGEVGKKKLAGTIGRGNGKLYLKTSSGSIKIR